jgi:hypothetical protein
MLLAQLPFLWLPIQGAREETRMELRRHLLGFFDATMDVGNFARIRAFASHPCYSLGRPPPTRAASKLQDAGNSEPCHFATTVTGEWVARICCSVPASARPTTTSAQSSIIALNIGGGGLPVGIYRMLRAIRGRRRPLIMEATTRNVLFARA